MVLHKFKFGTVESGFLLVNTAKYNETTETVSKMDFLLQSTLTTFALDDDIEFYDSTTTLKFKGKITKIDENLTIFNIEVKDLGNELTNTRFTEVYRNQSPEAIIEDIITNKTSLTFSSTVSTGLTIPKRAFRDELEIDAIKEMMESFNGTFSVDKTGVFTLIRKQDTINVNQINTNSGDVLQKTWKNDSNKKYTKIIVQGATIDQRTIDDTNSGSFSQVTLAQPPKNIQVTNSVGTILTQTTSNINGDYDVDIQAKTIDFSPNQTDPVIDYTFESQIKVEIGSGSTLILVKSYIESENEALDLALSALDLYKDGIQTSQWLKTDGTDLEDYMVGESIPVTDSNNNILGDFQISEVKFEYPDKLFLTVGEDEDGIFNWQKETQQRIKELEQKDQSSEFITLFDFLTNLVNVEVTSTIEGLVVRTYDADTFYLEEDGSGTRNQMLEDGTGPVMREMGYDEDDLLASGSIVLEDGNNLVLENGNNLVTD